MKKILSLLSLVILLMSTTGCVSTKKIRYFQEENDAYAQAQRIIQQYEMRLKSADQVYVKLTCSDEKLLEDFNKGVIVGSANGGGSNMNSQLGSINGFTVDTQGDIILPMCGKLHVAGLTTEECAKLIEQRIIELGLITDPEVTVRLLNARVAVIGAVKSPGVISLTSERNTIIDILAQCGDIDDTGHRYNVRLYREENGMRKRYDLDLTKADVFQSPAFYVQQNDMIYVEPNKSKSVRSSAFYTFMSAAVSIFSAIMSAISIVFLYDRFKKG
ncbi:MAG: polysaccharide biosynthesis/export family protein [Bacteroidaceae bacterium]|nr:polysaccharide biosynthesis/export family protein [Bacteroidaceae bacterium]